jgi:hypothetical protein
MMLLLGGMNVCVRKELDSSGDGTQKLGAECDLRWFAASLPYTALAAFFLGGRPGYADSRPVTDGPDSVSICRKQAAPLRVQ